MTPGMMTLSEPTGTGFGTTLETQMVPPKTHSVWVVLRGPSGTGRLGVVVRDPELFTKTKPEDRPIVGSSFLIGTREELRMLLSTRYWPLFEAAKAPVKAGKSFRAVVKVCSASLYSSTFPSSITVRIS